MKSNNETTNGKPCCQLPWGRTGNGQPPVRSESGEHHAVLCLLYTACDGASKRILEVAQQGAVEGASGLFVGGEQRVLRLALILQTVKNDLVR